MGIFNTEVMILFFQKRVDIDEAILQIFGMVQIHQNSPHLEKNSIRALSSASCFPWPTYYHDDKTKDPRRVWGKCYGF